MNGMKVDCKKKILSQVKNDGNWSIAVYEICGMDNYSNFLYNVPKYVKYYRASELANIWYYGVHYDFETRGYRELCKYYDLNPYHPYDINIDECKEQAETMKSLIATSIIISSIYEWLVAFIIIKFIKAENYQ